MKSIEKKRNGKAGQRSNGSHRGNGEAVRIHPSKGHRFAPELLTGTAWP